MTNPFCCEEMQYHLTYRCPEQEDPFACPNRVMIFSDETQAYGIPIHDGGQAFIRIRYCPWCGRKL